MAYFIILSLSFRTHWKCMIKWHNIYNIWNKNKYSQYMFDCWTYRQCFLLACSLQMRIITSPNTATSRLFLLFKPPNTTFVFDHVGCSHVVAVTQPRTREREREWRGNHRQRRREPWLCRFCSSSNKSPRHRVMLATWTACEMNFFTCAVTKSNNTNQIYEHVYLFSTVTVVYYVSSILLSK